MFRSIQHKDSTMQQLIFPFILINSEPSILRYLADLRVSQIIVRFKRKQHFIFVKSAIVFRGNETTIITIWFYFLCNVEYFDPRSVSFLGKPIKSIAATYKVIPFFYSYKIGTIRINL